MPPSPVAAAKSCASTSDMKARFGLPEVSLHARRFMTLGAGSDPNRGTVMPAQVYEQYRPLTTSGPK
jgi:hypothetical protein